MIAAERPQTALLEMLKIALPTVATMTSYTAMQFVDKWMVSKISPDPIWVGAQGNGGLIAWIPISIIFGSLFVINTFVSQNLGAGKPERAPAYAWNGLWICVAAWLILIPASFAIPFIFDLIRDDSMSPEQLAMSIHRDGLATGYAQILLWGSVVTMASRSIGQFFYGLHKPMVVLIAGVIGNLVNFLLNYCLIYGNFGFPRMELVGSAIATVIGTVVELSIPLCVFMFAMNKQYQTRRQWKPSPTHLKEILKLGWASGAMFGNEMICWGFFMVYLVGHFGPDHSTAGWIAHQWMSLSFMPAVGISMAVTAAVGKQMGAGNIPEAARRAKLGLILALGYMCTMGLLFVVFREPMVRLFLEKDTPPEKVDFLISMGGKFLIAAAAFQTFDAIAMTLGGALRGAGDTVWLGVATVVLSWSIIVGGGFAIVHLAPGLQSVGPWIAAAVYIFALSMATLLRFLGGKWKLIKLVDSAPVIAH